ncbi:hypothetical protein V9T40_004699 [Parthenolecanium corni]|uniref:ATP-dependent DNA helicase n=1 Tax=Parthenolecanium corni TaxID=536013 RepID=A0AAN9XYX1_9HEMI
MPKVAKKSSKTKKRERTSRYKNLIKNKANAKDKKNNLQGTDRMNQNIEQDNSNETIIRNALNYLSNRSRLTNKESQIKHLIENSIAQNNELKRINVDIPQRTLLCQNNSVIGEKAQHMSSIGNCQNSKRKLSIEEEKIRKMKFNEYRRNKYTADEEFRIKEKQRSSINQKNRYKIDEAFRNNKLKNSKQYGMAKYKTNKQYKENKIVYIMKKYHTNEEFRKTTIDKSSQYLKEKYHTYEEFRKTTIDKSSQYLMEKYHRNEEFRKTTIDKSSQYVMEKYHTNEEFRKTTIDKSSQYVTDKYHANEEFRKTMIKQSSQYIKQNYHSNEEFKKKLIETSSNTQNIRLSDPKQAFLHCLRVVNCEKQRMKDPKKKKDKIRKIKERRTHNLSIPKQRGKYLEARKRTYRKKVLSQQNEKQLREKERLLAQYSKRIQEGPDKVCCSCGRLFFEKGTRYLTINSMQNSKIKLDIANEACILKKNEQEFGYICITCFNDLKKNKISRYSLCNEGMLLPNVPPEVANLTLLEERFISPRIGFMKLVEVPINKQYKMRGRVINVPTNVEKSVEILPRTFDETETIAVALRRKKEYQHFYLYSIIRPLNVINALRVLKDCAVFKYANINVDESRFLKDVEKYKSLIPEDYDSEIDEELDSEDSDSSENDDEPLNAPPDETLLIEKTLVFAPGEGSRPLSMIYDEYAECMTFMKLFGGELMKAPNKMTYQQWCRWRLIRNDRRFADITSIFYMASKIRILKITSSIAMCMRMKKFDPKVMNSGAMCNEDFVKSLIEEDVGYKMLAIDRGSPSFWSEKMKELLAMIRQLGPPTLFLTVSAAETRWTELLKLLVKILDDKEMNDEDIENLNYKEKCEFIRRDPVTCARYFDHKFNELFRILKNKNGLFHNYYVIDYYIRVEFQQRGSPHCHCLLWLNNAPKHIENDSESAEKCTQFIDKFITCTLNSASVSEEDIELYQSHKHTFTCKRFLRRGGWKCRFGIPFFPMKHTSILYPFEQDELEEKNKKLLLQNHRKIRSSLCEMYKSPQSMNFKLFLESLDLEENDYIASIRISLKKPEVFIRRNVDEIKINNFNEDILQLFRSNMDIQFITDAYACANYVVNYMIKTEKSLSKLIEDAIKDIRKGNYSLKEKFRSLANVFLNASEFSAQEAVYFILGMPLSKASRECVFINTGPPERRIRVVKPKEKLINLPNGSVDIFMRNQLDYYTQRPKELENKSLADYVAKYNFKSHKCNRKENVDDEEDEYVDEEGLDKTNDIEPSKDVEYSTRRVLNLKDGSGSLVERQQPRIIRYVNYHKEKDEDNFYREQLMLFNPWRDENKEILNVDLKTKYTQNETVIKQNRKEYVYNDRMDNIADIVQDLINNPTTIGLDDEIDHEEDMPERNEDRNRYAVFDDDIEEGDIGLDIGTGASGKKRRSEIPKTGMDVCLIPTPHVMVEEEYYELMRKLNERQRKYCLHVMHELKSRRKIYEFVNGSAGVGKSVLIKALNQSIIRYYNSKSDSNPGNLKVLLCAPTGKAAYNIGGITLHSAFVIPINQFGGEMTALSDNIQNTLYSKLHDVEVVIIDEISMVGSNFFQKVNERMCQIFKTKELFGGKSVLLFGDFYQLPPVGDNMIFEENKRNVFGSLFGNHLWRQIRAFELTDIMRQKDDYEFAKCLNNLARGNMTDADIKMLKSREFSTTRIRLPEKGTGINLFVSNAEVKTYNNIVLSTKENWSVKAIDDIKSTNVRHEDKNKLIAKFRKKEDHLKYGLCDELILSIGIRYMITVNIDVPDGLFNGAVGILKYVQRDDNNEIIQLWLTFDNKSTGKHMRSRYHDYMVSRQINLEWTPIEKVTKSVQAGRNLNYSIIRKQFPLTPAEALTIYKSQGATYENVVANLKYRMRRSELYVALSRVTSLNGLFINGIFNLPIENKKDSLIKNEMARLLNNFPVKMNLPFIQDKTNKYDHFVFHNVQSLRKHIADVRADSCYTNAGCICFVETWTKPEDDINLSDYSILHRINCKDRRKAYGIVLYSRNGIVEPNVIYQYNNEEMSVNLLGIIWQGVAISFAYKSPSTSFLKIETHFLELIRTLFEHSEKVILVGDYNVDYNKDKKSKLFKIMQNQKLEYSLPAKEMSTNGNTCIDIAFSNYKENTFGFYESYFSYHKPIICCLDKNGIIMEDESQQPMQVILENKDTIESERNIAGQIDRNNEITEIENIIDNELRIIQDNTEQNILEKDCNRIRITTRLNEEIATKFPQTLYYDVKPFTNDKGVSCYANAIAQMLLTNKEHFVVFPNLVGFDNLYEHLIDEHYYKCGKYLSTNSLRNRIGGQYVNDEQQDASEFLLEIVRQSPIIEQNCKFVMEFIQECTKCKAIVSRLQEQSAFIIYVDKNIEKCDSLELLIRTKLNTVEIIQDYSCVSCKTRGTAKEKIAINTFGNILIVNMQPFIHEINENGEFNTKSNVAPNCTRKKCSSYLHPKIMILNYNLDNISRPTDQIDLKMYTDLEVIKIDLW